MSEPLSRERIEMRVMSVGCSDSDARWLLDRVAELEKEVVEWKRAWDRGETRADEEQVRAERAEAGLAAAQEALEDAADTFEEFEVGLQMLGHPTMAQAAGIAKHGTRAALALLGAGEGERKRSGDLDG